MENIESQIIATCLSSGAQGQDVFCDRMNSKPSLIMLILFLDKTQFVNFPLIDDTP
jgi:hypothetical protein